MPLDSSPAGWKETEPTEANSRPPNANRESDTCVGSEGESVKSGLEVLTTNLWDNCCLIQLRNNFLTFVDFCMFD